MFRKIAGLFGRTRLGSKFAVTKIKTFMTSSFRSFSSNIEVSVAAALVVVSHEWLVPRKVKTQTTRSRTEEKYKEKLLPTRKAVLKGWNSFICRGKTN